MSVVVQIEIAKDETTAALRRLVAGVKDRTELNRAAAGRIGDLVKRYVSEVAAPSRHKTALRLGAIPTGYLEVAAQSVTHEGNATEGLVSINQNFEIFKRVAGPVLVMPRATKKWLTIPAIAAAHGRRAREIGSLRFQPVRDGLAALVRGPKYAKRSDGKRRTKDEARAYRESLKAETTVFYWLKRRVVLPQDRGLLPTEQGLFEAYEAAVQETLMDQFTKEKSQA